MKILIDIGHPSHVHYFKNFIIEMKRKKHIFLIIARDKEITFSLLKSYGFSYKTRGTGKTTLLGKLFYIIKADWIIIKYAHKFKPDIFLSFGTPYAAHAARIIGKPYIALDDTDVAPFEHMLYVPFSKSIISPFGYKKNFGKRHIIIDSIFDLLYLNPKQFTPDLRIKNKLGIKDNQKNIFIRFTSMNANHDWKHKKFSINYKLLLINTLKKKYRIFLSSEDELPVELKKYQLSLEPTEIHQVLYFCDLFIGESGSMSTEAMILGTPSINIAEAALGVGIFKRLIKFGILNIIVDVNEIIEKAEVILNDINFTRQFNSARERFLNEVIDPGKFLMWFIENYPSSKTIMKANPEFQYKFKLLRGRNEKNINFSTPYR